MKNVMGVEDVAKDESWSQLVDAEATADPCEQTVDGYDEGQDGNPVAENLACNYEAGHGSLNKAASACNAFTGASFSSSSPRLTD